MYVLQVFLECLLCVLTAVGSQGLLRVAHCFIECLGNMLISKCATVGQTLIVCRVLLGQ